MKSKIYELHFKFYIGESDLSTSWISSFPSKEKAIRRGQQYAKDISEPGFLCQFRGTKLLNSIKGQEINFVPHGVKYPPSEKQYALAYWTVDHVHDYVKNSLDLKISRRLIEKILKENEERIEDAVSRAGWDVIEKALGEVSTEA